MRLSNTKKKRITAVTHDNTMIAIVILEYELQVFVTFLSELFLFVVLWDLVTAPVAHKKLLMVALMACVFPFPENSLHIVKRTVYNYNY